MTTFDIAIAILGVVTFINLCVGGYLMIQLQAFPDQFENASSPSPIWPRMGVWVFYWYSLSGKFAAIPDVKLVRGFRAFQALQISWLLLLALVWVRFGKWGG